MFKFCSLASGSTGNCLYLTNGVTNILVDFGISYARVNNSLKLIGVNISDIDAVLITHDHTDHINGLGTLAKKNDIPIFSLNETKNSILFKFPHINNIIEIKNEFSIGDISISTFNTCHDTPSVGFSFICDTKKITIATDLGCITDEVADAFNNSDFAFIESNHDMDMLIYGNYPEYLKRRIASNNGHLSNKVCSQLVCNIVAKGTKKIMLGHLSKENNTEDLALFTSKNALEMINQSADIYVAPKDHPSNIILI